MSNRKQRLELTWIGKDERPRLEPRILLEDAEKSHHAKARVTDHDIFDNVLIQGDNLLALKALEQEYTGKVKCVFIDPPYNTGSAFEHYDDGIEHSLWLSLMRDRLDLIKRLLADDGSLWITIDDNEAHYLKVLCDETFGRANFISNVVWEKSDSPKMDSRFFSSRHDHLLVFAKNIDSVRLSRLTVETQEHYNKVSDDGRRYYTKPLRAMGSGEDTREARPSMYFKITAPDGSDVYPKKPDGSDGRWRWGPAKYANEVSRIEWVKGRGGWTPYFRIFEETGKGRPPETIWAHSEVGSNRTSKAEVKALFGENDLFTTPKPEALICRVLQIATLPGDLVLDSFAGSGTTGAVAHKMGRRWVMVELGDHCSTHIVPRMKKVIDGTDAGGVTEAVEWKGGGGFRYYRLAPSLLEKDPWGNWVISKEFDAAKLSQAVCKLMGFVYQPDETHYWMQGRSSETDFIYVTTQSLTHDQLSAISEVVGDERTLLVCCKAFRANADAFPNLTIRKIPQAVLRKCEWGHDDYSLNVANLPEAPRAAQETDDPSQPPKTRKKRNGNGTSQDDLFSQEGGK
ncbi:site-specific DNA-methyltransferase [Ralstonia solanacearum]|uniref:site-specific DNA-methyltransferase (adenine-specific) n=1 Tax=Ralstonia solanacearum TaxID=305 RepID=A0AAD0S9A2_RALSL|nr:site-specific DNA-methyltransferase [Ralstonia solanacearum]AXV81685.1 site-specific DNA-methyltransferase [Ralstonia solanacearum]AXW52823.1 site-specific DNA-methyltransferase [Ralstonia solanacearum]